MSKQQNLGLERETRMFTPMEAILDKSFGAITCPTCDGLFTHESFLKSHYKSEDNECTQPIPSLFENISVLFDRDFLYHSFVDAIKTSGQTAHTKKSNESKRAVLGLGGAWKFAVLVLFMYILYNVFFN